MPRSPAPTIRAGRVETSRAGSSIPCAVVDRPKSDRPSSPRPTARRPPPAALARRPAAPRLRDARTSASISIAEYGCFTLIARLVQETVHSGNSPWPCGPETGLRVHSPVERPAFQRFRRADNRGSTAQSPSETAAATLSNRRQSRPAIPRRPRSVAAAPPSCPRPPTCHPPDVVHNRPG